MTRSQVLAADVNAAIHKATDADGATVVSITTAALEALTTAFAGCADTGAVGALSTYLRRAIRGDLGTLASHLAVEDVHFAANARSRALGGLPALPPTAPTDLAAFNAFLARRNRLTRRLEVILDLARDNPAHMADLDKATAILDDAIKAIDTKIPGWADASATDMKEGAPC